MTDRKTTRQRAPRKQKRGRGRRVPRAPMLNEMTQKHTWDYGTLSSGTAGVISASDMSASIQNFTEYSTLSSLFNQVKLLSCSVTFSPLDNGSGSHAQSVLYVGTNMEFTANSNTPPTSASQVENLPGFKVIPTSNVRPVTVRMVVPRGLAFSAISADAPATPTPWAGSPGCVVAFATGGVLSNSVRYFYVTLTAVHHFRGRV